MTQNKFKKIFVGGLPPQTTESDMREYFSKYGEVCDVVAMRDKTGNKSRGFGFVVFKEAESVDRCQSERPHQLLGKIVDTKRAMPKEDSVNPDIHCNSKRIFIGGLRRFFTEEDLRNYFQNFGHIVDCTIKRDSVSGVSRGFAFITFTDRDIVDKVILSKPHLIRHCIVDVKKAMSPEELKHLDENHNHQNNNIQSEYEADSQKIIPFNQEQDNDSRAKDNNKKIPKRSQSYPQSDFSNYGYYVMPPELNNSTTSSPISYPYDQHQPQAPIPLIWMSVQQCADGLILTPVATDIYNPNYPSYYSPSVNPVGVYPHFFHSNSTPPMITTTTSTSIVNNCDQGKLSSSSPITAGNCDASNGSIDINDLKTALPTENNHSTNSSASSACEEITE